MRSRKSVRFVVLGTPLGPRSWYARSNVLPVAAKEMGFGAPSGNAKSRQVRIYSDFSGSTQINDVWNQAFSLLVCHQSTVLRGF